MANKLNFLKIFFILTAVFAIIGLLDSTVALDDIDTLGKVPLFWTFFVTLFSLGIIILSIIAIVKFSKLENKKILLIMPIYQIAGFAIAFGIGFYMGFMGVMNGIPTEELTIPASLVVIGIISSIIEFIFSIYMLYRFRDMD